MVNHPPIFGSGDFLRAFYRSPGKRRHRLSQHLRCPQRFIMRIAGRPHLHQKGAGGQILIEPLGPKGDGTGDAGGGGFQNRMELGRQSHVLLPLRMVQAGFIGAHHEHQLGAVLKSRCLIGKFIPAAGGVDGGTQLIAGAKVPAGDLQHRFAPPLRRDLSGAAQREHHPVEQDIQPVRHLPGRFKPAGQHAAAVFVPPAGLWIFDGFAGDGGGHPGGDIPRAESRLPGLIKEALLVCPYITGVERFTFTREADCLRAAFTVRTVYGALEAEFTKKCQKIRALEGEISAYGEKAWEFLFGTETVALYKLIFVGFVTVGAIVTPSLAFSLSDTFNALMMLPNLTGVLLLWRQVLEK